MVMYSYTFVILALLLSSLSPSWAVPVHGNSTRFYEGHFEEFSQKKEDENSKKVQARAGSYKNAVYFVNWYTKQSSWLLCLKFL
jgi:hypothetical protein